MRFRLICAFISIPLLVLSQQTKDNLISIVVEDAPLEVILDSISAQSNYFFSYNSELFPKGSRYSITSDREPIDKLLSRLLIGTGLKYSFYKDQIILNYQPPEENTVKKKKLFTISGNVLDENRNPISGVNIFLDGTSIGSYSDAEGNYILESIPPGFFDIVFSHIGYESGVYRISEYNGGSRIQNHRLNILSQELQEIDVITNRAESSRDNWIVYYSIFKEEVLGVSEMARQCVIENPEVINFSEEGPNKLVAYADDVIIIRNDALGYRIDYFLESFEKKDDGLRFRGKMRFRNQEPVDSKESREWKKNRKESYEGSFNHFKKALLRQELKKEGFRIYSSNDLSDIKRKKRKYEISENEILSFNGDSYDLSFKKNLIVEFRKEKESKETICALTNLLFQH